MIRLRHKDGTVTEVSQEDTPFVEVVNDIDGTVGKLIIQVEPGKLLEIGPGSQDAMRYEAMMKKHGVKFAEMIIHRQ